jgi:hypothetical protein
MSPIIVAGVAKSPAKCLILFVGAPEEIRTPDPQIRSLVLYPAELRALGVAAEPAAKGGLRRGP